MAAPDRAELIYLAKLAEQAERYEEMIGFITEAADMGHLEKEEEVRLLITAFNNAVGQRRSGLRLLKALETTHRNDDIATVCGDWRKTLMKEVALHSMSAVKYAEAQAQVASGHLQKAMLLKAAADHRRYLAEYTRDVSPQEAADSYEKAVRAAESLSPVHPVRLSAVLNQSVCVCDILGDRTAALRMAQAALEATQKCAVEDKQAAPLLKLLRDNIRAWAPRQEEPGTAWD